MRLVILALPALLQDISLTCRYFSIYARGVFLKGSCSVKIVLSERDYQTKQQTAQRALNLLRILLNDDKL